MLVPCHLSHFIQKIRSPVMYAVCIILIYEDAWAQLKCLYVQNSYWFHSILVPLIWSKSIIQELQWGFCTSQCDTVIIYQSPDWNFMAMENGIYYTMKFDRQRTELQWSILISLYRWDLRYTTSIPLRLYLLWCGWLQSRRLKTHVDVDVDVDVPLYTEINVFMCSFCISVQK